MADTKISDLAALSATPASGDLIPIVDVSDTSMSADGTTKYVTYSDLGVGGIPVDGWVSLGQTLTYDSADDPTYVATCAGVDLTSVLSVGMRIRVSQSTGGTKYFIITAIAFSTDTTLTLYGGTDYNLENEAISSPYYSPVKAPLGFPLDETKWTVKVTDTTSRSQASPVSGTFYNLNSLSISLPIGCWRDVGYQASLFIERSGGGVLSGLTTLSTSSSSESDAEMTARMYGNSIIGMQQEMIRFKSITMASKTAYYFLVATTTASMVSINLLNAQAPIVLRAVCAYL